MTLTAQQLTEEAQNIIDTSGAVYIDEATHLLSRGGVDALRKRCVALAANPKTPSLKLFMYQLALACVLYPSIKQSQSEALAAPVTDTPVTSEEN
jgi:hypothetical protein